MQFHGLLRRIETMLGRMTGAALLGTLASRAYQGEYGSSSQIRSGSPDSTASASS
jgi:hypothetical protein